MNKGEQRSHAGLLARPKRHRGLTLIELVISAGVGGVLLLAWSSAMLQLTTGLAQQSQHSREVQAFHQLALWLVHDIERQRGRSLEAWSFTQGCLLYGVEDGVRLHNQMLQWRGGPRGCDQGYWTNLLDPQIYQVTDFAVYNQDGQGHLYIAANIDGEPRAWQHRFAGALWLTP